MRQRLLVIILLIAAVALVATLVLVPRNRTVATLSGYVEGQALHLASPVSGSLTSVQVQRGDRVKAGQALFTVNPDQLAAQRDQASADLDAAEAQASDARRGLRPGELAVYDANIAAAVARAADAQAALRRVRTLVAQGIYAQARLDDAQASRDAAQALLLAAQRQRAAATLGARAGQVQAADSRVSQAKAGLKAVQSRLADISPTAPVAAQVEEVFFQTGEWAVANQPILALLPDDQIKLRFFVPEATRAAYVPGAVVRFGCDGCASGLSAKITYISPRPEFTPPVIYSRGARDRLVYLVEARPSVTLRPGQPVDVAPLR